MKISEILSQPKKTLSFEVFPPKKSDNFDKVRVATEKIAELSPDYMSVTFGAGGKGARYTLPIAANIEQKYGFPVVHHLTCVGSSYENIDERLIFMKMVGIENVLALRGDIPEGETPEAWDFHHANELVAHIKEKGGFCIGGACYPDVHPEANSPEEDIKNLALKVEAGCEYLTTQLIGETSRFFSFKEKCLAAGINVPIVAGIMPILTVNMHARCFGGTMTGMKKPLALVQALEKYKDDPASLRAAGMEYACSQIDRLYSSGVRNVHLYTMNDADVANEIKNNFKSILNED